MALNTWEFSALLGLGSLVTGIVGALTGLGGGFIVVPLLTLGFGVDIRYAIGASLICVIATSSGAAARYVRDGYSNIRLGMFLELATTRRRRARRLSRAQGAHPGDRRALRRSCCSTPPTHPAAHQRAGLRRRAGSRCRLARI